MLFRSLFPTGPFFPGFTLTVFLTGIAYGSFLHKHGPRSSNLVAASIMVVAIRVGLDTLWLSILFDDSYLALMPVRLVKGLIDIPLQIVLIPLLWTVIAKTPIKTQIDKKCRIDKNKPMSPRTIKKLARSDIEQEMDYISVFNDIILALGSHQPLFLCLHQASLTLGD